MVIPHSCTWRKEMWGQKQNLFSIILHIMHDDPTRMTGLISLHLCGFLQLKLLWYWKIFHLCGLVQLKLMTFEMIERLIIYSYNFTLHTNSDLRFALSIILELIYRRLSTLYLDTNYVHNYEYICSPSIIFFHTHQLNNHCKGTHRLAIVVWLFL